MTKKQTSDAVVVSVKMPRALRTRLRLYKARVERTLQAVVADAVEEYMKAHPASDSKGGT